MSNKQKAEDKKEGAAMAPKAPESEEAAKVEKDESELSINELVLGGDKLFPYSDLDSFLKKNTVELPEGVSLDDAPMEFVSFRRNGIGRITIAGDNGKKGKEFRAGISLKFRRSDSTGQNIRGRVNLREHPAVRAGADPRRISLALMDTEYFRAGLRAFMEGLLEGVMPVALYEEIQKERRDEADLLDQTKKANEKRRLQRIGNSGRAMIASPSFPVQSAKKD